MMRKDAETANVNAVVRKGVLRPAEAAAGMVLVKLCAEQTQRGGWA